MSVSCMFIKFPQHRMYVNIERVVLKKIHYSRIFPSTLFEKTLALNYNATERGLFVQNIL